MNTPSQAQQEKRRVLALPKVGILHSGSEASHGQQIAALLSGLSEGGYSDGDDVTIVTRFGDSDATTLANNAKDLVENEGVAVLIAAGGSISALAAKTATEAVAQPWIPVVFTTVTDPVANGLVASLDEPGGHITGTAGLTSELDPKRLELLKEFSPATFSRVGVLVNTGRKNFTAEIAELRNAATALGVTLEERPATMTGEIAGAISGFAANIQAILVTADPLFNNRRKIVIRAVKARTPKLPAIYQWREFPAAGGLMSYGPSIVSAYQQAGIYAAKILDGSKPKDLPVMLPNSFELVINFKTASRMGFKIPVSMLTRAVLLRRK